jgi:hypothetical protein
MLVMGALLFIPFLAAYSATLNFNYEDFTRDQGRNTGYRCVNRGRILDMLTQGISYGGLAGVVALDVS